jgi:hypothetical protein
MAISVTYLIRKSKKPFLCSYRQRTILRLTLEKQADKITQYKYHLFESVLFFSLVSLKVYVKTHSLDIVHRTMSHHSKDRLLRTNSSGNECHQLRVYYVRIHDTKDELTLTMDFGNKIHLTFDEGKQLDHIIGISSFIYTLDFILKMGNSKNIYVKYKDRYEMVDVYFLKLSHTISKVKITATHDEKENMIHCLSDLFNNKHFFLFNIHFDTWLKIHVAGKKRTRISEKT